MAKYSLHISEKERRKESAENKRFSTVKRGWGNGFVTKATIVKKMLLPHFWGAWLAIFALFLLVTFLPYRLQMYLGKKIGRLMGSIIPARKYVLKRNLELAFPNLSEQERYRLSKDVQRNSGMAIFETGIAWFWPDWRLKRHIRIDENDLKDAIALSKENKPILVLSCHFVTLELMARIYATLITPGIGVYRPSDHPVWEWVQVHGRLRKNLALVDRNDPRSMLKALMKNMPIWYAPDQDYGRRVSVFVPFFAVKEAATVVGTHNLARVKNTVVQPAWTIREGGYYHLYVKKPLENFPSEDATADAARVNREIEKMVLMAPEQYLWLHRRFKTAPNPEENRYPGLSDK
ncbi:MAG: LpxL/LpxP family Kdo(2)-lipid IV(A) lauroyl/palmitoleoyl acyltransferase [Succinivibrio sp.]